jgi:excisionase family DNA binding protein
MTSPIVAALIRELADDPRALDELAEQLAPRLRPEAPPAAGYLDTKAAAAFLACKPSRIHNLVHERRLRARKDGSRLLFRMEDLEALLVPTTEGSR